MRALLLGVLTLACAACGAPEVAPLPGSDDPRLGHLAWLVGTWEARSEGRLTVEFWRPPRGGVMLGGSQTIEDEGRGETVFYEQLRIEAREDGVYYVATPRGAPPTAFEQTRVAGRRVTFENPQHDFPTTISYELSAEGLRARISGSSGGARGEPRSWLYRSVSNRRKAN